MTAEMKNGDIVKIQDFPDDFKVISTKKVGTATRFELVNLRDNTVRTYFSPPVKIRRLLSPVEKVIAGEFDDSDRFNLMVEASRLSCMFLYDPLLSLSTTKITIFPHQVEAVYRMLDNFWPRYLLADDAGLGKTIMAGMLIKELELRKRIERVLVVVPAALTYQWRRELSERFDEKFVVMDSGLLNNAFDENPEENPWGTYSHVITSLDFVKRDNTRQAVAQAGWDLTIIDEAHKLSAHQSGKKVHRTRRFMLGEALQENSNSLLLLSATPHSGESYAYRRLLSLLDPYAFAPGNPITTENLQRVMIRRTKETVRTLEGQELFPPRIAKTLVVGFSPQEKQLYDAVVDYVTHYFNLASKSGNRGVTFAMIILQKRMASGIAAITKSLENRLNRLKELRLADLRHQSPDFSNGVELPDSESTIEDLEEKDKEALEKKYELITMAKDVEELSQEIDALENLVKIAQGVKSDSKANSLLNFIEHVHGQDSQEKILIFTEYKDTLNDLIDRIRSKNTEWKTEVATIHGGMTLEERIKQEEKFKLANVTIMVATDAAGEGLNLQFAHLMVNYELPWNPNRLEQRIGRLHRIGQTKKVIIHNMLIQDTIEGDIFKRLLEKIETIQEEIGDRVFDVLGLLMQDVKIEDLVMQAVGKDSEWIKSEMSSVEGFMDDAKKQLLENIENKSLIKDSLDLASIQKIIGQSEELRLTPAELERFVGLFFKNSGGKIERTENRPGIFTLSLPRELSNDEKITRSLFIQGVQISNGCKKSFKDCRPITFTKEIAEKEKDVRFIALGHPLLSRIIDNCVLPKFGGSATVKVNPDGNPGALFVFRCRLVDAENNIRGEKLLSICWDKKNNFFREVDSAAFWEMEKSDNIEGANNITTSAEFLNDVFQQAQVYALGLTEDLFDNIKQKVGKEVAIKSKDIQAYKRYAEKFHTDRILEAENRLNFRIGGKSFYDEQEQKQIMGRNKAAIKKLVVTTENALERLRSQTQLLCDAPECLAIAILLPSSNLKKGSAQADSSIARKLELEQLSLDYVMKREIEEGRRPIDVSKLFKGYDIVSEGNNEKRFIEVKSFKDTGPLELTSHEWVVSQRLNEKYWLYIVENVEDTDKKALTMVRNPFSIFSGVSEEISLLQFRILIDHWKAFLSIGSNR